MKALEIQSKIKSFLDRHIDKKANSDVWALSNALHKDYVDSVAEIKRECQEELDRVKGLNEAELLTQEQREEYAAKILDKALINGEMTLPELDRFKEELGLSAKKSDTIIQTVDFSTYAEAVYDLSRGDA